MERHFLLHVFLIKFETKAFRQRIISLYGKTIEHYTSVCSMQPVQSAFLRVSVLRLSPDVRRGALLHRAARLPRRLGIRESQGHLW